MTAPKKRQAMSFGTLCVFALLATCCATKKYVQESQQQAVHPLEAHISKVEQATEENTKDIRDLDRRTEQGLSEAQSEAENAKKQAADASKQAADAQTLAQKGVDEATRAQRTLVDIDNYQPVTAETILFGFNRSDLTQEGKSKIDDLCQAVGKLSRYYIEVQGFTDSTGSKQYNLELSRRRAESVVRYLTEGSKVPLARVHVLGYGEDVPAASNSGSHGRKVNRRVDVRLLASRADASPDKTQP